MSVHLDGERLAGLAKVAEAADTRHAALLAELAATLGGLRRGRRFSRPAIGVPMRTRPAEFAEATGVFVNEMPLVARPRSADAGFPGTSSTTGRSARTRGVRAAAPPGLGAAPRAGLAPWRPASIFGYRRSGLPPGSTMAGAGGRVPRRVPGYRTGAELELQLLDHGDDLDGQVGYDPRRFGAAAVRALLGHWYQAVELAGAETSRPLRTGASWTARNGGGSRR